MPLAGRACNPDLRIPRHIFRRPQVQLDPSAFLADPELIKALEKRATRFICEDDAYSSAREICRPACSFFARRSNTFHEPGSNPNVFSCQTTAGSVLGVPGLIGNQPYSLTAVGRRGAEVSFITAKTSMPSCNPNYPDAPGAAGARRRSPFRPHGSHSALVPIPIHCFPAHLLNSHRHASRNRLDRDRRLPARVHPTGYLLVRLFRQQDIRSIGSGNIGATNVLRSGGKGLGAPPSCSTCSKAALRSGWADFWARFCFQLVQTRCVPPRRSLPCAQFWGTCSPSGSDSVEVRAWLPDSVSSWSPLPGPLWPLSLSSPSCCCSAVMSRWPPYWERPAFRSSPGSWSPARVRLLRGGSVRGRPAHHR